MDGASCGIKDLNSSLPIKSQIDLFCSDPKNQTVHFKSQTSTAFLKFSNTQDHLFQVRRQQHSKFTPTAVQVHFLSGVFMTNDDCHIISARA